MKKLVGKALVGMIIVSALLNGCATKSSEQKKEVNNSTTVAQKVEQKKPVKIMYTEPRESNQEDLDKVLKYMQEKSGVKFEAKNIKTLADFEGAVNISIASGEDIDVILVANESQFRSLAERNAFQKINDTINKYGQNMTKQFSKDAWKSVTDKNGNILGIPREADTLSDIISIRKDWREKLKIAPITTLEEFEKYLRALKDSDFDGNGIKDTIPLTSNKLYDELDAVLLYIFTETNPVGNYIDTKGNVTPVVLHPQYKEYLKTLAKWNKEGLLHSDLLLAKKAQIDDLIIGNKVGALAAWYSDYIRPTEKLMAKVSDAQYEYITPKTNSGKDYKLKIGVQFQPRAGILATSSNTEFAVRLFDWIMSSPENYWTTKQGIEGENWKWANKEKGESEKLKGKEKPETAYNYTYSFLYYAPWDFRATSPGFVDKKYYEAWDWHHKYNSFVTPPDWFATYIWKGTPVETSQQDALTLIQENKAKIILGEKSLDEWDSAIEKYKKIHGDKFIELATKQYNEFKK